MVYSKNIYECDSSQCYQRFDKKSKLIKYKKNINHSFKSLILCKYHLIENFSSFMNLDSH
jgi:hypothetical protein